MSRFRPSFFIPLIAFLGLAIIGGMALQSTLSGNRNPSQLPSVLIGKAAPDVALPLLQDRQDELALGNFQGQPLLVNFFASWCAPCRAEAPALEQLSEQITIIGIAYKTAGRIPPNFCSNMVTHLPLSAWILTAGPALSGVCMACRKPI